MPSDVTVTIKLSGQDYRTLCMELEYHQQTLKEQLDGYSEAGPGKRAAMQRLARFQNIRERVAS